MRGVKANTRVGVYDSRIWNPAVEDRAITFPAHQSLTAAANNLPPEPEQTMPEPPERSAVPRYRVVLIITALHSSKPFANLRQRFVHPAAEFLLELLQFCSHPFARRFAPDDESAFLESTVVRESQK